MKRLSLDAFKAQVDNSQTQELENLTGGILGACHVDPHEGAEGGTPWGTKDWEFYIPWE